MTDDLPVMNPTEEEPERLFQESRHGRLSRRATLTLLGTGIPAAVSLGAFLPNFPSPLVRLGKELMLAWDEHEWWSEKAMEIDSAIPPELVARLSPGNQAANVAVDEWCRMNGYDYAEQKASEAIERRDAIMRSICTKTAMDMPALMIHAQTLAYGYMICEPARTLLVEAFIRGLDYLRPTMANPAASDVALLSACDAWNAAIDEMEVASSALDGIHIPAWASLPPEWASDPDRRAAIADEQRRTGYRAAQENFWAAKGHVETIEDQVSLMTASSVTALRAQAVPLLRGTTVDYVTGRIGMALVRGLERLGGSRSFDLHIWWGTEANDPPTPIDMRRS